MGSLEFDGRRQDRRRLRADAVMLVRGTQVVAVRTIDVCKQGMAISAERSLASGELVRVRFPVPAHPKGVHMIDVQAQITTCVYAHADRGFRIELHFKQIAPACADALHHYLSDTVLR